LNIGIGRFVTWIVQLGRPYLDFGKVLHE
jgi:hypothetical protein